MLNIEQKEGKQSSQTPLESAISKEIAGLNIPNLTREVSVNDCRPGLVSSEKDQQAKTPAFGMSASALEQQSNHNPPSSFTAHIMSDVNQNSSHISSSSRHFQSLLTPTLFMKMPGPSTQQPSGSQRTDSMRNSLLAAPSITSGIPPVIPELNSLTIAANSEKNTQNDGGIQRMNVGPQFEVPQASGFTVLGSMKGTTEVSNENNFESPPRPKSIAQRNLAFMQQQVRSSPQLRSMMLRQQTTPPRDSKGPLMTESFSDSKNKENINSANFGGHADRSLQEEVKGSDVRIGTLSMQMFNSPDKKVRNANQIMMQNESPAADSCQSAQNAFANLNICNTAGSSNKYQSALAASCKNGTSRIQSIQSGAILDIMGNATGVGCAPSSTSDHATSNNDFLSRHITTSPMFKGFLGGISPKNSPIEHRINIQARDLAVTSLNMKLENHAHDHDLLPSQIMSSKNIMNERSSASFIGYEGVQQRVFNPDLEDPVLSQLQNLGPTASGTKVNKTLDREELSARRLFQSPNTGDPLDLQNSAAKDPSASASARKHSRQSQNATSSVSSQIGFKHIHQNNKGIRVITKVLSNQLEDIIEEPIRMQGGDQGGQGTGNNSLNIPLFSNHHHPFDTLMISNNSAQMRLNNLIDGPNSGDSGRKMRSFLSTIPDIVHSSGGATGDFNNSHLQGTNIVHRLDNDFTMAEVNNTSAFGQDPEERDNHYTGGVGFGYPQIDNHFSFNANVVHQHLSDHSHPQFHYGAGSAALQHNYNQVPMGAPAQINSLSGEHHKHNHGKSHHGLRSKNSQGLLLSRNATHHHHMHGLQHNPQHNTNYSQFHSTQQYDIQRKGTSTFNPNQAMTYSSFQGEQMMQQSTHQIYHQCQCGGSYPAPVQPPIVQSYHHNQNAQQHYEGQLQSHNHVHHRAAHPSFVGPSGKPLRHNHPLTLGHHGIPHRSLSMKANQRGTGSGVHIHGGPIPHPPHRGKKIIHKNATAVGSAGATGNTSIQLPSFDLTNSNFYNANIQMNVYIPSPPESNSANSSQATTNLGPSKGAGANKDLKAENMAEVQPHGEEDSEYKEEDVKMQTASKTTGASAAQNQNVVIGSLTKKQMSMSSSKKNKSGLKKRLYPQFLDSSNQKNITTPSTNCGLMNSTSKSNQKSTLKKRQQELHNQNVISPFDINVNQAVLSQQTVSFSTGAVIGHHHNQIENDKKFQTPKGPNIFHHHLGGSMQQTSSGSVIAQGTPDNHDKDMANAVGVGVSGGSSSNQKNQQAVFQHSIANHQRHQLILGGHSDTKSSSTAAPHIMESGDKNGSIAQAQAPLSRPTCNCKRSKCLKLYCDCFALGLGCGPDCNCQDCSNVEGNEERNATMVSIIERNPHAFKPKILEETGSHSKGCHCKKSGCLKKYCECYQSGVLCTDKCVCDGCQNCDERGRVAAPSSTLLLRSNDHAHSDQFDDQGMLIEDEGQNHHHFALGDISNSKSNEEIKVGQSAAELSKNNQNDKIQNYETTNEKQQNGNPQLELSRFENTPVSQQKQGNDQHHEPDSQFSSCDPSTRKVRNTRQLTHDLEKLLLSDEKMATPEENLESKNSARKRRATDLNSSQNQQLLPQTPISKKTKQAQSSAKAVNKTTAAHVNRVILDQIVTDTNDQGDPSQQVPPAQQQIVMSSTTSAKKAPNRQKTPIKIIQNQTGSSEDQKHSSTENAPSQKQVPNPPAQQTSLMHGSPKNQHHHHQLSSQQQTQQQPPQQPQQQQSCITTRSKRKQLEAAAGSGTQNR